LPAKAPLKKNKSAIKRARQNEALNAKNRSVKSMLKTLTKNVEKEIEDKSAEGASTALKKAVSAFDKAAQKGILHKNTVARRVAKLTNMVNSLSPSEAA
jgi:small subunit ribosomal protein S20